MSGQTFGMTGLVVDERRYSSDDPKFRTIHTTSEYTNPANCDICSECDGRGKFIGIKCKRCDGKGWIA